MYFYNSMRPIGIICIEHSREKPEKLERIDVKRLIHYQHMAQSEKAREVEYVSASPF
jgi:hypothetical protein